MSSGRCASCRVVSNQKGVVDIATQDWSVPRIDLLTNRNTIRVSLTTISRKGRRATSSLSAEFSSDGKGDRREVVVVSVWRPRD